MLVCISCIVMIILHFELLWYHELNCNSPYIVLIHHAMLILDFVGATCKQRCSMAVRDVECLRMELWFTFWMRTSGTKDQSLTRHFQNFELEKLIIFLIKIFEQNGAEDWSLYPSILISIITSG